MTNTQNHCNTTAAFLPEMFFLDLEGEFDGSSSPAATAVVSGARPTAVLGASIRVRPVVEPREGRVRPFPSIFRDSRPPRILQHVLACCLEEVDALSSSAVFGDKLRRCAKLKRGWFLQHSRHAIRKLVRRWRSNNVHVPGVLFHACYFCRALQPRLLTPVCGACLLEGIAHLYA